MHWPGDLGVVMSCDTLLQASEPFPTRIQLFQEKKGLLEVPTTSLWMSLCPFQRGT